MKEIQLETRRRLGTDLREPLGRECKPPTFAPPTKRFRAIDLSCRACDVCGAGAGCWAWIPGGGLRSAPVSTPNLRSFHWKGEIRGSFPWAPAPVAKVVVMVVAVA